MLPAAKQRIRESTAEMDRILDVGGWAQPFPEASWVIDLQPYETRGLYGYDDVDRSRERFTPETWVVRDICSREPWPFADDSFDFVVCSHTLEDVRDPVWVCSELRRVGRAGYIEVPSRLEEQTYGIQGDWVGWDHHRWFCDVTSDAIEFVFKAHYVHGAPGASFPHGFLDGRSADERVASLWWQGGFTFRERLLPTTGELDAYLVGFVNAHMRGRRRKSRVGRRLRRLAARRR